MNSFVKFFSSNKDVFWQKTTTPKTPVNQINSKQLQNTKTIKRKENQNIYIPRCVYNNKKENQKEKEHNRKIIR